MQAINVTELRNHLQRYLSDANQGNEILVTAHGKIIARILPPADMRQKAKKKLIELRKHCKVGDVISPIADKWEAEQ